MTKIKFGDQHDDSTSQHEIVSDGGESEIAFGNQYDRSKLRSKILDLKDPADLALIAGQLTSFTQAVQNSPEAQAHPEDVKALKEASAHAAAGDGDAAKDSLKKVGKWVLDTATAVAMPVAIQFLKTAVGLPG